MKVLTSTRKDKLHPPRMLSNFYRYFLNHLATRAYFAHKRSANLYLKNYFFRGNLYQEKNTWKENIFRKNLYEIRQITLGPLNFHYYFFEDKKTNYNSSISLILSTMYRCINYYSSAILMGSFYVCIESLFFTKNLEQSLNDY